MKLHVGERLPGFGPPSHPGGYVVTAVAAETPWYGLYAGKKICYHFDFTAKRPREADEAEWLDVYLRTVHYSCLDDPGYVAGRRSLARAELRRILGNRTSNLWPEPLDLLEVHNTRDPFAFAAGPAGLETQVSQRVGTEPIIVFARPKGEPLARWQQQVQPLSLVLGVLAEVLEFIRAAHGDGLLLNGLGPSAVVVDAVGRVHYLGSDMAVAMPASAGPAIDWARFFPPERYPRGFSAPECFDPDGPRDGRADLYAWAALVYFLLTHDRPAHLAVEQGRPWVHFGPEQGGKLELALRAIPPAHVRGWGDQLGMDGEILVRGWPHNLLTVLPRSLNPDPQQRPTSVSELRTWLGKGFPSPPEAPARASLAGASGWEEKPPSIAPPRYPLQGLLPDLARRLAREGISPGEVRGELDRLGGTVAEKILLCRQLPDLGVDATAAATCLRELEKKQPLACPECRGQVAADDMETHLRQVHRVYQFRGIRRPREAQLAALLTAICASSPDYEAYRTLDRIAREEFPEEAEEFLADRLCRTLKTFPDRRRGPALAAVAEAAVAAGNGPRLVRKLADHVGAAEDQILPARLTLELTARLPAPLPTALSAAVRPLLSLKILPIEVRLDAAASLLRATDKAGKDAAEILQTLVAGSGKARAIERLRLLEKRVGNSPAIDELCAILEDQVRMICPRCSAELLRPAMRKHLWDEHQLILDGRRVRDPWRLIEDWLEDYRLEREAPVLERCRNLARRLEGDAGLARLERLILAHGIEDAEAQRRLLAEARRQRQSLCPHCFGPVPVREEAPPVEVRIGPGRLTAPGFRVEVSEAGLVWRLTIEAWGRVLYRGREPGRGPTRRGWLLALAGLALLAALVLALGSLGGLPFVLGALGLSGFLGLLALVPRPPSPDLLNRAVDFAWTRLVRPKAPESAAFAAGLAQVSAGWGRAGVRAGILKELREEMETRVAAGTGSSRHLAALWRLAVEEMARSGADAVPLVVAQVSRCFDGRLPLAYAAQFLTEWDSPIWTAGNVLRLRVLLCARAFEAGLEVPDLLDIARAAPPLGKALRTDDPEGLARLRLLWGQFKDSPWDKFGRAVSVFELAKDAEAGRNLLARHADLLLVIEESPPLLVCVRGIVFGGELFLQPPRAVEVVRRSRPTGEEFELVLEQRRFPFARDPDSLARRLERLFRYAFHDFPAQATAARRWRSLAAARNFRDSNTVACPECHRRLLPRLGEVGLPLGAPGETLPPARETTGPKASGTFTGP